MLPQIALAPPAAVYSTIDTILLESGPFDPSTHTFVRDGDSIRLSPTESKLLAYLAAHPQQTLEYRQILREVFGYRDAVNSRTVYTTVGRLRSKIERDPSNPRHIRAVSGLGYRFEPLETTSDKPKARRLARAEIVGRQRELAQIGDWLALEGALVTLTGVGGIGKTRLAEELADEREGLFISCEAETTQLGLLSSLGRALGAPITGDPVAAVAAVLQGSGPLLVVLDNLEQATEPARQMLDALCRAAPRVCWLVTSRERLRAYGERVFVVGSLSETSESEPEPGAFVLFARHAAQARPDLAQDEARPLLAAIVAELEGHPLALLLAAARLRALTPADLLARLQHHRLDLLVSPGERSRHGSLRLALDVSWALLLEEEQRLLTGCAALGGHFDLAAIEAVAGGWVLDALQGLCDKSLLELVPGPPDEPQRYRIRVVVAEWVLERSTQGAIDPLRERAARWYAAMGEPPLLSLLEQRGGLARRRLAMEREHLAAAVRLGIARTAPEIAVPAARALCAVETVGTLDVGIEAARAALALPGPRTVLHVRLSAELSDMLRVRGHNAEARALAESLLDEEITRADTVLMARARLLVANASLFEHEDLLLGLFEEALSAALASGDEPIVALVCGNFGTHLKDFDRPRARQLQARALACHRANDNLRMQAVVSSNLALMVLDEDPVASVPLFEEALALHRSVENRRSEAITLGNLGLALSCTEPEDGWGVMEEAIALHRRVGNTRSEALLLGKLAADQTLFGHFPEARRHGAAAIALHQRIGNRIGEADLVVILSDIDRVLGLPFNDGIARALALYRSVNNRKGIGYIAMVRAEWHLLSGDAEGALSIAASALPEADEASIGDLTLLSSAARGRMGDREGLSALRAIFHERGWTADTSREIRRPCSSGIFLPRLLLAGAAAACGDILEAQAAYHSALALATRYGFKEGAMPLRSASIVAHWLREASIAV